MCPLVSIFFPCASYSWGPLYCWVWQLIPLFLLDSFQSVGMALQLAVSPSEIGGGCVWSGCSTLGWHPDLLGGAAWWREREWGCICGASHSHQQSRCRGHGGPACLRALPVCPSRWHHWEFVSFSRFFDRESSFWSCKDTPFTISEVCEVRYQELGWNSFPSCGFWGISSVIATICHVVLKTGSLHCRQTLGLTRI